MTPSVADLADANLVESVRQHALWQQPCEWVEEDGMFMMVGANHKPFAYRNCAIRVDRGLPAGEVLARARAYFGARGRHFTLFLRDSRDADLAAAAEADGLQQRLESPCMLVEAPLQPPEPVDGVAVHGFDDLQRVADAVTVNAEAYESLGLAAEELHAYFSRPKGLLSDRVAGFVAYRDGKALATALTIMSGEGAGLYWVGTREAARGQGLGAWCTALATQAGFERGARVVTLQASPFGEPIYRRLGYQTYDRLRWYS